ncbi:MAG: LysE family translocator [Rhizobiaceae bacterium]
MLVFATAVFFLIITPGPGVLSAAGVGASYGYRPGLIYIAGLLVGNNMVALSVILGLAGVLEVFPPLRTFLFVASACFLLYLAAKIAFAGTKIGFIHPERAPGIPGGIALQAVNPKAYVVNTALFSGFPFMAGAPWAEAAVKLMIFNVIWLPIHLLWLAAGVGLNRLDLSDNARFAVNAGMAVAMLLVVGLAAFAKVLGSQ